jgi:hypothetical protein
VTEWKPIGLRQKILLILTLWESTISLKVFRFCSKTAESPSSIAARKLTILGGCVFSSSSIIHVTTCIKNEVHVNTQARTQSRYTWDGWLNFITFCTIKYSLRYSLFSFLYNLMNILTKESALSVWKNHVPETLSSDLPSERHRLTQTPHCYTPKNTERRVAKQVWTTRSWF